MRFLLFRRFADVMQNILDDKDKVGIHELKCGRKETIRTVINEPQGHLVLHKQDRIRSTSLTDMQ